MVSVKEYSICKESGAGSDYRHSLRCGGQKSRAIVRDPESIDGLLDGLIVRGWRSVCCCRLQIMSSVLSSNNSAAA
jgi:hypothetical protein